MKTLRDPNRKPTPPGAVLKEDVLPVLGGFIDRAGAKQLLRVISEGQTVVMVITVTVTSKFETYGVSP